MTADAHLRPTRAEIDLGAVAHNVRTLLGYAEGAELCAVVKADGYGHGAVPVARAVLEAGASWLAVALVEEGEELRRSGVDAPILLLAEPPPRAAERLLAAGLTATVYSPAFGDALDAAASDRGEHARVHVKADTGMARVGVPRPDWQGFLDRLRGWPHLDVEGLWTHLARADEPGSDAAARQLDAFAAFVDLAAQRGIRPQFLHTANSAATLRLPAAHHDLVRVGIALYGLSPSPEVTADAYRLRPAMRLVTEVAYAKRVAAGTPVSYGHTWSAPADGWLATLPVGYADGVPRRLSNRAEVLIGGARHPVAGTVCMDQLLVWCGDHEVAAGDEAVLLGTQGAQRVTADAWAAAAGTITYEVATSIGARVPRHHHN